MCERLGCFEAMYSCFDLLWKQACHLPKYGLIWNPVSRGGMHHQDSDTIINYSNILRTVGNSLLTIDSIGGLSYVVTRRTA